MNLKLIRDEFLVDYKKQLNNNIEATFKIQ